MSTKIHLFNLASNQSIKLERSTVLNLGRGFFECHDKRVSRKHGELTIFEDRVSVKALHVNPIFYKQIGHTQYQILHENDSVFLEDKECFSLLPNEFFYEVRVVRDENGIVAEEAGNNIVRVRSTAQINSETLPSLAPLPGNDPEDLSRIQQQGSRENEEPSRKRSHEEDAAEVNAKRTKSLSEDNQNQSASVETVETAPTVIVIKPDPDAPAATTEASASSSVTVPIIKPEPVSQPTKPTVKQEPSDPTLRPSCQFGVRCYRQTPDHRASTAHPSDADYRRPSFPPAPAEAPPCPFGASCYRRNPDHFVRLQHPPSTVYSNQPPQIPVPPAAQVVNPPPVAIALIYEGDSSSGEEDLDDSLVDEDFELDVVEEDESGIDDAEEDEGNNCEE